MKKKVLALIAAGLFSAPMLASAVPVQYDLTYTATTGPNGVGSFTFDQDDNTMSAFQWDFGGVLGNLADVGLNNPFPPTGVTFGQFIFEMITEIDVHPAANCTFSCSFSSSSLARTFILRAGSSPTTYELRQGALFSTGFVTFTTASVPEPATLGLLVLGLLAAGARRRAGSGAA